MLKLSVPQGNDMDFLLRVVKKMMQDDDKMCIKPFNTNMENEAKDQED
jgi:hypothetical protein